MLTRRQFLTGTSALVIAAVLPALIIDSEWRVIDNLTPTVTPLIQGEMGTWYGIKWIEALDKGDS